MKLKLSSFFKSNKSDITPSSTVKSSSKLLKDAINLLDSDLVGERRAGAERLALLHLPESIPYLLNHLEISEDPTVLSYIIGTLRSLRDIRSTEKIIEFLKKCLQAPVVGYMDFHYGIYALADSKDPRGVKFIYSLLKDYRPNSSNIVVGMAVIDSLEKFKYKKAFNDLFKFISDRMANKYLRQYSVSAVIAIDRKKAVNRLLKIYDIETDWAFKRSMMSSIIYSGTKNINKSLKKYENDEDPYIRDLVQKYMNGEVNRWSKKEVPRERRRKVKYLITNNWSHDVVEYRRWINDLFRSKFKVHKDILKQDETIARDLNAECKSEVEFNTLILMVASQIDLIQEDVLNTLITLPTRFQLGTINKLELFLSQRVKKYDPKVITNLRLIHKIRSKKLPIHVTSDLPELLKALGFYTLPPDWELVWEKLKELYSETLKLLKESLETV